MTPQCNMSYSYTKQPLIKQNRPISFFTSNLNSNSGAVDTGHQYNEGTKSKMKYPKVEKAKKEKINKIKCVLVGDKAVGKTSLAVSYSNDSFPSEYIPTAYDIYNVEVQVDGKPIRVELCDTAGQAEFNPLRNLCYPGTDVFILCFSIVKPQSFRSAYTRWAEELKQKNAAVVVVGTQKDLQAHPNIIRDLHQMGERPVLACEGRQLAEELNAPYIETSAKTSYQLKEAFDQAITMALLRQKFTKRRFWKKLCCIK